MDAELKPRIMAAVDELFDTETEFLAELTRFPSTRGNEQAAQDFMARAMADRGLSVDRWQIDVGDIRHLPGFSPVLGPYEDAVNVVGAHHSQTRKGRSLILNGHIDVVPEGPEAAWDSPPYAPRIDGGWMYGRGAGDMKAGLAANLFALDALRACGHVPAADVFVQSVVEEECTGNGALACLQRGYRAAAALIPEPMGEALVRAQVGVIWFQVHLLGRPTHAAVADKGANAVEAAIPLIHALHALEARWNAPENRHPEFVHTHHPLAFNIGRIEGGDWTSSVPAWCTFDVRIGIYPGQPIAEAKAEVEAVLQDAAREVHFLRNHMPRIVYHGFEAEGYVLAEDQSDTALAAIAALETAHAAITGAPLDRVATTGTTDSRFFGLYADTPALVYGPHAEGVHGFNERVELESLRRVTQTTALFIADWCGLEPADGAGQTKEKTDLSKGMYRK